MSSKSGLRKLIDDTIGKEILENHRQSESVCFYCQERIESLGPFILPPIPDNKFIDVLPEGPEIEGVNLTEKEHQDAYEAEVIVYRRLEEIDKNSSSSSIVIHQLDYTHEQYSAFIPAHLCNKKKCKKGPRELEGECDFIVIRDRFVAVLEVKGLSLQNTESDTIKFKGCCDSATTQRKRLRDLVKSIDPSVMVYEFTIFPNISMNELEERYLYDETILFNEDLENMVLIIDCCEEFLPLPISTADFKTVRDKLCCSLLGLWCINQKNKWNLPDCSLSKSIKDVDEKLKKAHVTRRSVEEAEPNHGLKKKKGKMKKYPQNPRMVEAPDLFKEHFKIRCLTQDQLDVFNSNERFLWVDGPAGTGKTIVMLGKITHLALTTPPEKRILLVTVSQIPHNPASFSHQKLLNSFKDITCEIVTYMYQYNHGPYADGYVSKRVAKASRLLSKQLSHSTSKIVLLICYGALTKNIHSYFSSFHHVFVDDYQALAGIIYLDDHSNIEPSCAEEHVISGLHSVIKNRDTNNTSIWVFCDGVQSVIDNKIGFRGQFSYAKVEHELRSYFIDSQLTLSVNLRNTYEISTVLSIAREHYKKIGFNESMLLNLPQQVRGHFLRGTKPVFYLIKDDKVNSWQQVLARELLKLLKLAKPNSYLKNNDIAILVGTSSNRLLDKNLTENIMSVLVELRITDETSMIYPTTECLSAEWPAVIAISMHGSRIPIQLLYIAMSRARVYSAVIIYDYKPETCRYTDKLFKELSQRHDVCSVIEM